MKKVEGDDKSKCEHDRIVNENCLYCDDLSDENSIRTGSE